jgi:cytochrome P450
MSDAEALFPYTRSRECPYDPPPRARNLERPVRVRIWDGSSPWLVTSYEDVQRVLSDDEHFSADPRQPGYPEKSAAYGATVAYDRNLRSMDNPEHDENKRLVVRFFTAKYVESQRSRIRSAADELLAHMAVLSAPVDLVEEFALALPIRVICGILGVPFADREFFASRSRLCFGDASAEIAAQAGAELSEYIDKLIDRTSPSGLNLIGHLQATAYSKGKLSRTDFVGLIRLILMAGHETTANMIGLSVLLLLERREYFQRLKHSPELIPNAVEELLRYLTVGQVGRRRAVIKDVLIGGQAFKPGDGVIVAENVANRDNRVFDDPNDLKFERPNASTHLAFGFGIHQCLGQQLTRVELQVALERLLAVFPTLRLEQSADDLRFNDHGLVYGVKELIVAW